VNLHHEMTKMELTSSSFFNVSRTEFKQTKIYLYMYIYRYV